MNYYYYKNVTQPKVISTSFSDDSDTISFDLKSTYQVPSLLTLTRTNTYVRIAQSQSVVIQDRVKFTTPTTYEFGIPSRNGVWTDFSVSPNLLFGKFTVDSVSLNVRISASNPFVHKAVTKTINGVTYTRLGVSMSNPILEDIITVTFFND